MANKDIKLGTLKRYLKHASREHLATEITDLFTKFDVVRDYYQSKLAPEDDTQVIEKYKSIIKNEFFPVRGFGEARLSIARKAVSDYKKVCRTKASLADLMLFYVEIGVEFTNTYGDIDEPFYNSMESMYKKAVEFIVENELQEVYERRCRRIVSDTSEIGWGFGNALSYIYEQHFER
jgi:uncharacterized protein YktA (UPF0223 family)